MIKLPALWRSGLDTNPVGGVGGGGFLSSGAPGTGTGASPRRHLPKQRLLLDPLVVDNTSSSWNSVAAVEPLRPKLHNSVSRFPELKNSGSLSRAKLFELDELDFSSSPPSLFHGSSSSISNTLISSRTMGNRSSNPNPSAPVPVISYRSNGISYEKQDGAAYSIQTKRLEPIKVTTTMAEKSTQTSKTRSVALDTSSLNKPASLRGGSPPGPGWYSPKSQPSTPAYSMGSRLGSGSRSPAYSMSPRLRDVAKDRSPGPGQHNLPEIRSGPAYSMGARFKSGSRAHSPKTFSPDFRSSFSVVGKGAGPRRWSDSWTDSTVEGSMNAHANRPGHGVYSNYRPEKREKRKKEKEKEKEKKEVGYFIVKVNPKGPAYKITKTGAVLMPGQDDPALLDHSTRRASQLDSERRDSTRRESQLDSDRRDSRRNSSSISPRRPSSPDPSPGPGEHQHVMYQMSGPAITIKSRIPPPRSKEDVPGPGAYNVVSRPGSPSYSLGARRSVPDNKSSNPGPGTYRIMIKPHGPHYSLSGKPRDSPNRSRSPGPGAYKYDNGTIGYGLAGFSITGKPASPRASDVPGPGSYAPQTPRSCCFTIQSRQSSPRTPDVPGPGSYSPRRRSSSPSFTIRERLPDPSGLDTPGPGSYSSRSSMDGPSFSLHGRLSSPGSSSSRSSYPGPGTYTIPSRPTSPSFTMYGPLKKKEGNNVPGPGAYCPKLGRISPEFSIRGKLPVEQRSRSPGPGAYNVESGRSSPSFSIRGKISRTERPRSPGPGAYYLPKTNQAPAFSMYGRVKGPRLDSGNSPGPGSYRSVGLDSTRFSTPPKFSFGCSYRVL